MNIISIICTMAKILQKVTKLVRNGYDFYYRFRIYTIVWS